MEAGIATQVGYSLASQTQFACCYVRCQLLMVDLSFKYAAGIPYRAVSVQAMAEGVTA